MKIFLVRILVLATAIFCLAVPGSPAIADAHPAASDWFRQSLMNNNSRLCLVSRHGAEGPIEQTTCDSGYPDQVWERRPITAGSSTFQLRNVNSGLCLLARGRGESAATVSQCNKNFSDQLWWADGVAHMEYDWYHNVNSGLCLVARGTSNAIQTTCGNYADQLWFYFLL